MIKANVDMVSLALVNRRLAECLDELERLEADVATLQSSGRDAASAAERIEVLTRTARELRGQRQDIISRMYGRTKSVSAASVG